MVRLRGTPTRKSGNNQASQDLNVHRASPRLYSCIIPARTAGPSGILPENARIENPEALKGYEGGHVSVSARIDPKAKTVRVADAKTIKADESPK